MINMTWFYGDNSRLFWNWVNNRNNNKLYSFGCWLQNTEWKTRHCKIGWYALRWQLSTPVLFLVYYMLNSHGWGAVIIANLIGALIFYKIDKIIFKRN